MVMLVVVVVVVVVVGLFLFVCLESWTYTLFEMLEDLLRVGI